LELVETKGRFQVFWRGEIFAFFSTDLANLASLDVTVVFGTSASFVTTSRFLCLIISCSLRKLFRTSGAVYLGTTKEFIQRRVWEKVYQWFDPFADEEQLGSVDADDIGVY